MSPQFARRTHRAREILAAVGRAYPRAWSQADELRAARGATLPAWPAWCYLPLHGAYAIVSGGGDNRVPFERAHHTAILGAITAWRMTQGIYRYDPALYEAVASTPLERDIPTDPLYRLPEWCIYIETPDQVWPVAGESRPIHGVWAHIDWDSRIEGRAHHELRLVLDTARTPEEALDPLHGCIPIPLILGAGGIADSIERVVASGAREAAKHGMTVPPELTEARGIAPVLAPLVSLVLYLCADEAEIGDGRARPASPEPKRTRRSGYRMFAADGPRVWDVGVRIGAALRRAYQAEETHADAAVTGRHVRPHIRRAHWHTFLAGPRDAERERRVKWLPPLPINVEDAGDLPAVVRRVEE